MDGAQDVGIDLDMNVDCLTHNNVHPDSPQSFNMEPDSGGEKRKGDDNSDDDYEDGNPEKKLRMNHDDYREGYTTMEQLVGVTGDQSVPTSEDDLHHVSGSTLEHVEDSMTTAVQLATTSGQQIQSSTLSQLLEVSGMDSSPATPSSDKTEEAAPVNQAWFTTKEDKTSLHGKGHSWKQGMWSKEEVEVLKANIEQYCKDHNIEDAAEVVFEMSKDERKDFYRTIAKGLNRPLFAIYRRVLRMYDNRNHVGKYTPEEIERLKELRQKHGSNWAAIGVALGRSASSVKDRCRLMRDSCNSGKWSNEEETRLQDAVHEVTNTIHGQPVTSGISWAEVAHRVGTRSEKQCRSKWLNYLNWKQAGGDEWTKEDDMNLIHKVEHLDTKDDTDIDWVKMAQGWSRMIVRSPQWLRSKWWSLKRQIADHQNMDLPTLVQCLKTVFSDTVRSRNVRSDITRIKVTRLDGVTRDIRGELLVNGGPSHGQDLSNMATVQLPIPVPQAGATATITTTTVAAAEQGNQPVQPEESQLIAGTSYQSFEVLQSTMQLTPTSTQGTYILRPSSGMVYTATPTSSDQIIVQTVQTDQLASNENVTVQLTPQSDHIIISTSTGQDHDITTTLNTSDIAAISQSGLPDQGMGHPDDSLNEVSQSEDLACSSHLQDNVSQSQYSEDSNISQSDYGSHAAVCQSSYTAHPIASQSDFTSHVRICQSDITGHATISQSDLSAEAISQSVISSQDVISQSQLGEQPGSSQSELDAHHSISQSDLEDHSHISQSGLSDDGSITTAHLLPDSAHYVTAEGIVSTSMADVSQSEGLDVTTSASTHYVIVSDNVTFVQSSTSDVDDGQLSTSDVIPFATLTGPILQHSDPDLLASSSDMVQHDLTSTTHTDDDMADFRGVN
ncbi:cyclin-D-binding Myb-like transcription factor 1 isoform X3 [Branchiostoma floridae x Branchiostoma belcheri]